MKQLEKGYFRQKMIFWNFEVKLFPFIVWTP